MHCNSFSTRREEAKGVREGHRSTWKKSCVPAAAFAYVCDPGVIFTGHGNTNTSLSFRIASFFIQIADDDVDQDLIRGENAILR